MCTFSLLNLQSITTIISSRQETLLRHCLLHRLVNQTSYNFRTSHIESGMETAYQALPCRSGTLGRACSCNNGSCENKCWMNHLVTSHLRDCISKTQKIVTYKKHHFLRQLILVLYYKPDAYVIVVAIIS